MIFRVTISTLIITINRQIYLKLNTPCSVNKAKIEEKQFLINVLQLNLVKLNSMPRHNSHKNLEKHSTEQSQLFSARYTQT